MTNIVVTSPKGRDLMHKIEDARNSFWSLKRKPKRLSVGDIVWVVKYGAVHCGFYVRKIVRAKNPLRNVVGHNPADCWRIWFNSLIPEDDLVDMGILDGEDYNPLIKVKGFQGFRYQWW